MMSRWQCLHCLLVMLPLYLPVSRASSDLSANMISPNSDLSSPAPACPRLRSCHCETAAAATCSVSSADELRDVAEQLQRLQQLQLLDITAHGLRQLPGRLFTTAAQLRAMLLSGSRAQQLPQDLLTGLEDSLVTLGLGQNQLLAVPSRVLRPLQRLERLDLSGNRLKSIGDRAFQLLVQMRELNLADNRISKLAPTAFVYLPKLETLNLDGNPLTSHQISGGALLPLTSLRRLTLDRCQLLTLTADLTSALPAGLSTLTLSHNHIQAVDSGALAPLPRLTVIDLSHNQLQTVPDRTFAHLEDLNTLNLNGNAIVTLSARSFSGLRRLQTLDLGENSLEALPAEVVRHLHTLRRLLLPGNDIIGLDGRVLDVLPRLKRVDLSGNRLQCSCSLDALRSRLLQLQLSQQLPPADVQSAVCAAPPRLENAPLVALTAGDLACEPPPPEPYPVAAVSAPNITSQSEQLGANATLLSVFINAFHTGVRLVWRITNHASVSYRCAKVIILNPHAFPSVGDASVERDVWSEGALTSNCRTLVARAPNSSVLEVDIRWPHDTSAITDPHRFCLQLTPSDGTATADTPFQVCSETVRPAALPSSAASADIRASVTDAGVLLHLGHLPGSYPRSRCAVTAIVLGARGPQAAVDVPCDHHQAALDAAVGAVAVSVCFSAPYTPAAGLRSQRQLDPLHTAQTVVFVDCVSVRRADGDAIWWAVGGAAVAVVLVAALLTVIVWRRLYARTQKAGGCLPPRRRRARGFVRTLRLPPTEAEEALYSSDWDQSDPET